MESDFKQKKARKGFHIIIIALVFLFITGFCYYMKNNDNKIVQLKESAINYLGTQHTSSEIEDTLTNILKQLPKETNTEILDLYLHATYALASQSLIDDNMANALYEIMDADRTFDFSRISDDFIKAECEALKEQNIKPVFVNGNLFFDVDYAYFIEHYGSYLNNDYLEMIRFYQEEKQNDYYNSETNQMNYEIVENRMVTIYELIQQYPDSKLKDTMDNTYLFYKKIYLGAYAQDYVYDKGSKIYSDLLQHYRDFSHLVKDIDFRNFLNTLIADYEKSELTRTADIYTHICDFCR
ncbi:hypothetical protein [Hungatella hathewayi]|uniref:hypothetical protein n=1 Tax=Hungatella hathewayi TaxID=154046 RepID=UPI003561572B